MQKTNSSPRHPLGTRLALGSSALFVGLCISSSALAQTDSTSFTAQQYESEPGAMDIMSVQSSQIQGHLDWQLGAQLNVADDVLEIRDTDSDMVLEKIVESQTALDLVGAIGIIDRFEIGLVLPFTAYRTHGVEGGFEAVPMDLSAAALGDIRLVPKFVIPGLPSQLGIAVSVPLTFPTGKSEGFYGEDSVSAEPRLLAEYRLDNGTYITANLGWKLRSEKQFINLGIDNEFTYGLGVRAPFKIQNFDLAAISTLVGSLMQGGDGGEERPLEWLGGVEYKPTEEVRVSVAAGPGLSQGYGTPDFRLVAGVTFRRRPDPAPVKPTCLYGDEDMDGFEDDDECADLDNDQDGIADTDDQCPNEKGVADNPVGVGCPANPVPGEQLELEQDTDPDNDKLVAEEDACPSEPEDFDGFQDDDGCPDADDDKDGIPDTEDKCPLQAEIVNGNKDDDGCPDEGQTLVKITTKRILILEKVYFDTDKSTIKERSFNVLDQVAATLRANPQITKLRIEGHTDSRGKDDYNMRLSNARAGSVRQYLTDRGVDPNRLGSIGYGETRPIATNRRRSGRAKNRRVEFHIKEVNGVAQPDGSPDENQGDGKPKP